MLPHDQDQTLSELQEIGRQTTSAISAKEREHLWWNQQRGEVATIVQRFVNSVYSIEVDRLTEDEFCGIDDVVKCVVESFENHMASHVDPSDTGQLHFLAEATRSLRDARGNIIQGLSPDPRKRPSYQDREKIAAEAAEAAWRAISDI